MGRFGGGRHHQENYRYLALCAKIYCTYPVDVLTFRKDPSNIVRAEKAVRRSVKAKFQNFSVIRTNDLYRPVKTSAGPNPGITVVILAVKDFSLEGVKMEDGEDLIVDATEMIKFPMKGGALAIMFELEL